MGDYYNISNYIDRKDNQNCLPHLFIDVLEDEVELEGNPDMFDKTGQNEDEFGTSRVTAQVYIYRVYALYRHSVCTECLECMYRYTTYIWSLTLSISLSGSYRLSNPQDEGWKMRKGR